MLSIAALKVLVKPNQIPLLTSFCRNINPRKLSKTKSSLYLTQKISFRLAQILPEFGFEGSQQGIISTACFYKDILPPKKMFLSTIFMEEYFPRFKLFKRDFKSSSV